MALNPRTQRNAVAETMNPSDIPIGRVVPLNIISTRNTILRFCGSSDVTEEANALEYVPMLDEL